MDLSYLQELTPDLLALARLAGEAILEVYRQEGGFTVSRKADYTPVTEADRRANAILLEGLARLTPDIPVLSEESEIPAWEERKHWSRLWVVDPLDGTKEFIHKSGEFAIQLGLVEDGEPIFGLVHAPVLEETYSGIPGLGSFRWVGNTAKALAPLSPVQDQHGLRIGTSRSHINAETRQYLRQFKDAQLFPLGSGLKMCRIASGELDLYPRFGPTSEWDTAAPHAILRAVGGQVLDPETGRELRYNKRSLGNPDFVAGRRDIVWK